jgi:hypothetical protein
MSRTISRTPEAERLRYAWISTADAARLIGGDKPVSTDHVCALIEAGELTARNVAAPTSKRKEWRVDPSSIEAFLDRRTVNAA